jgi:hypothetical protein
MLSYLLNNTQQDPWLPIAGLFLFIALFIISVIWTLRRDKGYITKMSSLPLENRNHNGETTHG